MGPNGVMSSSAAAAAGPMFDRSAAFNGSIDSCSMSMSSMSPANYRKRSEMVVGTEELKRLKGLKSIESTPSSSSGSLDRGLLVSQLTQVNLSQVLT